MKVGVIAANGRAGRRIVKRCVEEGFDVTAIVRHKNQTAAQNVLLKDLFDLKLSLNILLNIHLHYKLELQYLLLPLFSSPHK